MTAIDCAAKLAKKIHNGQTDLAGMDFFTGHLCYVADLCYDRIAKIISYLHDAARYSEYSEQEIVDQLDAMIAESSSETLSEEDSQQILCCLKKLNQSNYVSREDYINSFQGNALLCFIKKTEIRYNIQALKMLEKSDEDEAALERYYKEYNQLVEWYNDPNAN